MPRGFEWLLLGGLLALVGGLGLWYAWFWPSAERFHDEQFNAANIAVVLRGGPLAELSGWYPPLTWLPQAALLAVAEQAARAVGSDWQAVAGSALDPAALRLCRLTHVAYGTLTLLLLFRIGSRLFDRQAGLVAAMLLGLSPWFLHAFSVFKPDAPLALFFTLALHQLTATALTPDRRQWFRLALAVALAGGSKITGVAAALPALWLLGPLRRATAHGYRWLLQAAALGLATLALLNAHLVLLPGYLARIGHFYEGKQSVAGTTRTHALADFLRWPFESMVFGALVGTMAAAGLAVWIWRSTHEAGASRGLVRARMAVLTAPVAYAAVYLAATGHFKANNFVPVLPVLALAAALALPPVLAGAGRLCGGGRAGGRRALLGTALLASAVFAVQLRGAASYVYRSVTPTTLDTLRDRAAERGQLGSQPVVLSEWVDAGEVRFEASRGVPGTSSLLLHLPDLSSAGESRAAAADAVVWRGRASWPLPAGARRIVAEPKLLEVRGPTLTGWFRPWPDPEELFGYESRRDGSEPLGRFVLPLEAALRPGDRFQLGVWVERGGSPPPAAPRAWVDGNALALYQGKTVGTGTLFF